MNRPSTSKESLTDWQRLEALADEDIDLSGTPEITPEMFAERVARRGLKPPTTKRQITIRLDNDVLVWFRAQGEGYQTPINQYQLAHDVGVHPRRITRLCTESAPSAPIQVLRLSRYFH